MKEYKVYIFDFDGTLVNTLDGLKIFYNYIFNPFGVIVDDKLTYKLSKASLQDAFKNLIGDKTKEQEFYRLAYEIVRSGKLLAYNKLFPDTLPMIEMLKMKNKICGIVTGNASENVNMVFKSLGVPEFYKVLVTSEHVKRQKPFPDSINIALELLNYNGDKREVCYIGDSIYDYQAAKAAGVTPIIIDRDGTFVDFKDCLVINNFSELL